MQHIKTDLSSLNDKQRAAVVSNSKRLLVLAGAGSGKTKTLLQKVIYLIEEKGINPANILAITFTKNAANEMLDRLIMAADQSGEYEKIISNKNATPAEIYKARFTYVKQFKWINNLNLKTFHGLCYGIMRNYGVNEFDNKFRIICDSKSGIADLQRYAAPETQFEVLHKILIEHCAKPEFLLHLKRYILDYLVDRIHVSKKYTPKQYHGKIYTSLNGTKVRSKSEQYIADWLFRHSIAFEYEPKLNIKDFDFRPDFFVPEANVYIEHVSNRSHPTKNKEQQFRLANKLLVKTYETQTQDTALFNLMLDRIVKGRLPANYHYTIALSFEEEFKFYHKEVKDFIRQVNRIIDMMKVENLSLKKVFAKSQRDPHERVRDFYTLAMPLIKQYFEYCTNKSYLDFNDLILKTINLFHNRPAIADKFSKQFHYILVDEFQDVNTLQVDLLKRLLTPNNQLFCVGDDWQSIYGFRGSDVKYIINFKKHFRPAELIKLNLNYRSTESIVGASNEVIKNNKHKIKKHIESSKKSNSKIYAFAGQNIEENVDFAVQQIQHLQQAKGYTKDDILFLYRRSKMFSPYFKRFKEERIFASYKTIHASKGLEAKAVFVLGLTEGNGGFPDIWMEDRIFQIIKTTNHNLLLEEERRLFYVAITRAKDLLFLLTEKGNESSFLKEIPDTYVFKTGVPFKPLVEKVQLCVACQQQINQQFTFCPFCGEAVA